MGTLEQGVGQAFAVKLGSVEPTSVELPSGHTGRAEVEESGRIYPGIHIEHQLFEMTKRSWITLFSSQFH